MESASDVFDCRVSQFYESLPLRDQIGVADGADEFFDVAATPPKSGEQKEEFFTPLPITDELRAAKSALSPVAEEPEHDASSSCERRKSSSDLPAGRIILKAKRRSWQIPKKVVDNVKGDIDRLAALVFDGIRLEPPTPEKKHHMLTRQDVAIKTPTLSLRNRQVVRCLMKRSVQSPKTNGPPAKFMGLAEQVQHFFNDTPPRFRRSPRKTIGPKENPAKERLTTLSITVPHSPQLLTKNRARSTSPQPLETHLIKAHPLNPKVFQPPDQSGKPPPKSSTVPHPFNLTVVPKKEVKLSTESTELIQFKARPVPKSCRSSMSSLCSNASTIINGVRRVPVYKKGSDGGLEETEEHAYNGVSNSGGNNHLIKRQPFSFDMRDRIAMQRKEQKIKMLIEESTKIPKFTARPVPSFISQAKEATHSSSVCSRKSVFHNHPEPNTAAPFKAKPATVLTKEPFKPKLANIPLTDITEFQLNTERRAKERAQYEQTRREKEKQTEEQLEKISKELALKEKNQIKELRKSMVPKPTPKPSFIGSTKQ